MRYAEIISETDIATKARKSAEKRARARKKIADADHKTSRAAQAYQDALHTANDSQRAAQQTLSDL